MSNPESEPRFSDLPTCGDFDMRIASDGTWFYRGTPINRKPLVKLFSTVLRREQDGEYWLVTPAERGRIAVESIRLSDLVGLVRFFEGLVRFDADAPRPGRPDPLRQRLERRFARARRELRRDPFARGGP